MISIEDRTTFTKAESKARQIKPRVTVLDYQAGKYEVAGSKPGSRYTVQFSKDANKHWQASCDCQGHAGTATARPCYHIPAAYSSHRIQVNVRKQVRAALEAAEALAPVPAVVERFCTCGSEIETGLVGDKCRDCLQSELFGF